MSIFIPVVIAVAEENDVEDDADEDEEADEIIEDLVVRSSVATTGNVLPTSDLIKCVLRCLRLLVLSSSITSLRFRAKHVCPDSILNFESLSLFIKTTPNGTVTCSLASIPLRTR